jgi:astacin
MEGIELYKPNMPNDGWKDGYVYTERGGLRKLKYQEIDGLAVCEGDIILGDIETMNKINETVATHSGDMEYAVRRVSAICITNKPWSSVAGYPGPVVPYEIASDAVAKSEILNAINYFNQTTEITFVDRKSQTDYIRFVKSDGCSSYVGRQGGKQEVKIANWAFSGTVIHELTHALGMWHEQSRRDRDHYVTINWDNIQQGKEHNFWIHGSENDADLDVYDYDSIMHYSKNAFGKNTITPKDPKANIGQRDGLSIRDRLGLQALYRFQNTDPITDICVIAGDTSDIVPPAGFVKIRQDVNQGSGGKWIYVCYKKGGSTGVITNIAVIAGSSSNIEPPYGYTKIPQDLNQGAGGKYIYLCYKQDADSTPITNLALISGDKSEIINAPGYDLTVIPQDLNQGAGGKYIYLCYQRDPEGVILDMRVLYGDDDQVKPPEGYSRINVDLNKGAGGKYLYFAYKRLERGLRPDGEVITDIKFTRGNDPCPDGYMLVVPQLNLGTRGEPINLCIKRKKDDPSGVPIADIEVIYGNFDAIQPPQGWIKISQDLNEGAGGDYLYLCYKK